MNEPFPVETERLALVAIPSAVLATQRREDSRELRAATTIDAAGTQCDVVYPADFAGDAIVMFASLLARREAGRNPAAFLGAIVERSLGIAVGNMGTHGMPVAGKIEIGYTIAPTYERRGYATEILRAFVDRLFGRADIREIVAETLADNVASMRVLEKCGFARTGSRMEDGGPLVTWSFRTISLEATRALRT